jgi:hypothetical protein
VFVIPDDVARVLRRAGKAGWVEVPGFAYGEGDRYEAGTQVHAAANVLLAAARALPAAIDDMDGQQRDTIVRDAHFGSFYPFVVGRSGWDDDARWWRDFDATDELRLPGSLHTWRGGAAVYWAG